MICNEKTLIFYEDIQELASFILALSSLGKFLHLPLLKSFASIIFENIRETLIFQVTVFQLKYFFLGNPCAICFSSLSTFSVALQAAEKYGEMLSITTAVVYFKSYHKKVYFECV